MSDNILQRAEEVVGQSRALTVAEVGAYTVMSSLKGLVLGMAGSAVFSVLRILTHDLRVADVGLSFLAFGTASLGWHLLGDLDDLKEGLKSYRAVKTYQPVQDPEPVGVPASPIVVRPLGGEPYVLDGGEKRTALPDGRKSQVGINPETLSVVLSEIIEKHDGLWSRERLMTMRVDGQRVTRKIYEGFTDALCKAGFLLERPQGGYQIPPDVKSFDDLRAFFPALPAVGRRAGGQAGREGGGQEATRSAGRGVTLAEKRRQRWLECGCDVAAYRGGGR